ncbi:MAG: flagellar filament capping protein FliD [Candidatus Brocadia sp.]
MAISSSITSAFSASSNIDLLVNQYMALERRPLTTLNTKKTSLNSSLNIYNDLKTKLSDLLTASRDLSSTSTSSVYNSRTSSSSDETKLTASAGTDAAVGTFQIRIKQLATGASIQSTGELITKSAAKSATKVSPGTGTIDVSKSFTNAGFANTPDGTVTINGQTFTLSNYSTVQAFLDAVNNDATANANIYYNKTEDKFTIEQKSGSTDLVISETGTNPFFTQAKITVGTYTGNGSTGIQSDVLLSKANFDTTLTSTTSGSFKINGITITYNTDTDTLDNVISRINSSTANVNAFYDSSLDKVILKSKSTGSTDTITLSDVSGNLMNVLKLSGATATAGTDAKFTINSTSTSDEITKSTNTFTINGVTYTLKNTNVTSYTDTTYTTVTVRQDTSAIQSKITGFLDKFNAVTEYIKDKSSVNTSTKTRGPLAGNATFTSLRSQLFQKLTEQITGLASGNPDYLNEIGITVSSSLKASLSDTTKFNNAITSNSKAVEDLFNSTNGVARKIETLLKPFVESSSSNRSSIIDETKNVISKQITDIDTRISRMETRLEIKERQYRQQFYKMQELLNNLVLQGNQITSLTQSVYNAQLF